MKLFCQFFHISSQYGQHSEHYKTTSGNQESIKPYRTYRQRIEQNTVSAIKLTEA